MLFRSQIHIPGTDVNLHCDTSIPQPRPFITTPFRRQVFDTLHGLGHPGANATVKLLSQRFVWLGVGKYCRTWARAFTPCQRSKVTRHVKAPLERFHLPSVRFSHVHIDLVGPLPVSLAAGTASLPSTDTPVGLRHSLSPTSPPKQSLKLSSQPGLLVSTAPSKSQLTRAGSSRPGFSRLWLLSPDPL